MTHATPIYIDGVLSGACLSFVTVTLEPYLLSHWNPTPREGKDSMIEISGIGTHEINFMYAGFMNQISLQSIKKCLDFLF